MKKTPVMMKRFLFNVCALTAVLLPLSGGNALTAMASSAAADRQSFVQYAYPEQAWYRISTSYQPGIAVRESPLPPKGVARLAAALSMKGDFVFVCAIVRCSF